MVPQTVHTLLHWTGSLIAPHTHIAKIDAGSSSTKIRSHSARDNTVRTLGKQQKKPVTVTDLVIFKTDRRLEQDRLPKH